MSANIPEQNLLYKEIDGEKKLCVSYSQMEVFSQCPLKWYKTYVEGNRIEKPQEALVYGSIIHETLEYFFKNNCSLDGKGLSAKFNQLSESVGGIPFETPESAIESSRDAAKLLEWIIKLYKYRKPKNEFEKVLLNMKPVGVEEQFVLPYKLPIATVINRSKETHVNIIGSIDLHMATLDGKYRATIDWKSGRKMFQPAKVRDNLQLVIYAMYIMRHYNQGLPARNYWFHTRFLEPQEKKVKREDLPCYIEKMNEVFMKMYNFESKENQKPCPTPLCWWCEHKDNCKHKSNYTPKEK